MAAQPMATVRPDRSRRRIPEADLARWRRVAGLLSSPPVTELIDPPPAHLGADLELTAALHATAGSALRPPATAQIRMTVLDATRTGVCLLPDVVVFDARSPGSGTVTPTGAAGAESSTVRPPQWSFIRLLASDPDDPADIRAAVLDAHSVIAVVDYRDVVAAPDRARAEDVGRRLGPWLALAASVADPGLITLAVDGVEASNAPADIRLGWIRRTVFERLPVPAGWPDEGVVQLSSRSALALRRTGQGAAAGAYRLRPDDRDAHGLGELAERGAAGFERDPVRWFTLAALRRAGYSFSRAAGALHDAVATRPRGGELDPSRVSSEPYARQHRAWLIGLGLAELVAACAREVRAAAMNHTSTTTNGWASSEEGSRGL